MPWLPSTTLSARRGDVTGCIFHADRLSRTGAFPRGPPGPDPSPNGGVDERGGLRGRQRGDGVLLALLQKNGWPRRVQRGGRLSSTRRAGPNGLFRIGSVLPTIALCVSARWNRTLRTAVQVPQLADLADEHGGWLERQCSGPVALPSWPSPPTSLLPRSGRTQRVFGLSPVPDQHRPGKDRQPQNGQSQQTPAPGCHQVTCWFLPRPSLESYFC